MTSGRLVLGLESTCDDTCAAVVRDGVEVLSNVVSSQEELHRRYGGVVPEIASRAHLESVLPVLAEALRVSGSRLQELDAVAVADRPGLIGGLLVSTTTAKCICEWAGVPLVPVNHIHAHLYAGIMASPSWEPPAVALTASGGHTLIYLVESPTSFKRLGGTIDDAGGEAFDKGANMLGLKGQGGAALDRLAAKGNPRAIRFPRPLIGKEGYDFSFAGLKTALLYHLYGPGVTAEAITGLSLTEGQLADVAASYQQAICDVLTAKAMRAAADFNARTLFVTGGVAANSRLRSQIAGECQAAGIRSVFPAMSLCTDNAAMIAGLGWHLLRAGVTAELSLEPSARAEED